MKDNSNEEKIIKKKGINFFKKIWYSTIKFDKYIEMAVEGSKKATGYLAKFILLMVLIISIIGIYDTNKTLDEGIKYISEEVPDFSYSNDELKIETNEVQRLNEKIFNLGYIIVDTNTNEENIIDGYKNEIAESEEGTGIIILKNKVIQVVKVNEEQEMQTNEITYSYVATTLLGKETTEFTKNDIVSFLDGTGRIYVNIVNFFIYLISYFITYFISTIIYAFLLTLIGNLSTLIARIKVKIGLIYSISIYSLTLPNILSLIYFIVRYFTGVQIKYFDIAYIAIAYIYLVTALFLIKSDLIRKQEIPVAEAQNVVKKEQDEENEKEENEDKEDKKEKKEEKEDKENTGIDENGENQTGEPATEIEIRNEEKNEGEM